MQPNDPFQDIDISALAASSKAAGDVIRKAMRDIEIHLTFINLEPINAIVRDTEAAASTVCRLAATEIQYRDRANNSYRRK